MDDRPTRIPDTTQLVACPPRRKAKPADPCAMVLFGATGDLTKRLVMPALYNLLRTKVLPEKFALIGVARAKGTAESWRDQLYGMLKSFVGNAAAEFDIDHIDEPAWKAACGQDGLWRAGRSDKARELYDKAARRTRGGREDLARHPRQRHLLSRGRRSALFGTVVEQLGKAAKPHRSERSTRTASLGSGAAW